MTGNEFSHLNSVSTEDKEKEKDTDMHFCEVFTNVVEVVIVCVEVPIYSTKCYTVTDPHLTSE